MTNREINETFNKFKGVHGYQGDINVLTSMTHYFLMDASYDNFKQKVEPMPLKHEAKRLVKRMADNYNAFFTRFFAPFDLSQRIYIGDKSDELRAHIANNVELARLAMMDCCCEEDVDTQAAIANIWLCNRFASEAQHFYQRTWKKSGFKMRGALYTKDDSDQYIDGILKYSLDLSALLYGDGEDVLPQHYEKFKACGAALTRRICDWINNDYQQELTRYERENPNAAAVA